MPSAVCSLSSIVFAIPRMVAKHQHRYIALNSRALPGPGSTGVRCKLTHRLQLADSSNDSLHVLHPTLPGWGCRHRPVWTNDSSMAPRWQGWKFLLLHVFHHLSTGQSFSCKIQQQNTIPFNPIGTELFYNLSRWGGWELHPLSYFNFLPHWPFLLCCILPSLYMTASGKMLGSTGYKTYMTSSHTSVLSQKFPVTKITMQTKSHRIASKHCSLLLLSQKSIRESCCSCVNFYPIKIQWC